MKQKKILPREMSYLRMTAQLLPASQHKKTAEEAVSHMLAMQGQQVYSFPHAVLLRTDNTNFSQVKAAFEAGFFGQTPADARHGTYHPCAGLSLVAFNLKSGSGRFLSATGSFG